MINEIKIKEVMTADVLVVSPDDTMEKVHDIVSSHTIHLLPVIDDNGYVVGMISKSDYLTVANAFPLFKKEIREEANEQLFRTLLVEDVMTKQVAKISPEDKISMAGGYFRENLFHAMPVVDEDGILVGIVSTYDLLTYFFNQPELLTPKAKTHQYD
jgi:CBS-domain-containing membrane protein